MSFIHDPSYAIQVDNTDANNVYVGLAKINTATSAAEWRIKVIQISGTLVTILWADGNDNFDNVWDNRASLT